MLYVWFLRHTFHYYAAHLSDIDVSDVYLSIVPFAHNYKFYLLTFKGQSFIFPFLDIFV